MATDLNQISQQLAQDMETLRNSVQNGARGLDQIGAISQSTEKKIRELGRNLDNVGSTFVKNMYNGTDALDILAATTKEAGNATAQLVSKFGLFGEFIGAIIKKTTEISAKAFEDLNKVFKGYSQISRQGATGAQGITKFYEQATKMGYGVEQLNEFATLIGQNTESLAMFGNGIVGAFDQIADVSKSFTDSGLRGELLTMGMRLEDINGGIMKYAKIMAMSGRQENMNQQQLTNGAQKYILELDRLSKLTGKSADVIQAEREARLQDERLAAAEFLASQKEAALRAEGRVEEANALRAQRDAQQAILDTLPKGIKRDLEASLYGVITDSKMAGLLQVMPEAFRYFTQGGTDLVEFNKIIREDLGKFLGTRGTAEFGSQMALLGNATATVGTDFQDLIAAFLGTKRVTTETTEAAKKNQIITDQTTASIGQLNDILIIGKQTMQEFLNSGVKKATIALGHLVNRIDGFLPPNTLPPRPFGLGVESLPTPLPGAAVPPTSTGQAQQTTPPGEAEAVSPGTYEPPGTVAPSQPARPAQPATPAAPPQGQQSQSILDLFNFGPRSGQPANVALLESGFRDRVIKAAEIYKKLTDGKKLLTVNSAFRTREDQQRLYDSATIDPLTGKRTLNGRPVAPPGNSDHERGRAIDLQQGADNDPNALAALRDAGLRRPYANDDVHFTARYGRLTSGPLGGYRATLHGNEVVIPLSNGTTIPLDMTPLIRNLDQNAQVLSEQIARLDDLITISRDSLNVNRKMLSYRS